VEHVREMQISMRTKFHSPFRIAFIEGIERMTLSAANSFLKILEEPPKNVVFILTTDKLNRILPTILSRVRVLRFFDIPREMLLQYLESLTEPQLTQKEIHRLLDLSDGKMGRIFHFLKNNEYYESYGKLYDEVLECLQSGDLVRRMHFVEKLLKNTDSQPYIEMFYHALLHIVRAMMRGSISETASQSYDEVFKSIEDSRHLIFHTNVNKRLILENLLVQI
jgi:DNA polymerase-3 subunit delta'